jgi:hypothetical protein
MYEFADIDITDSKRANGYVHYLMALQNLDPICMDLPISEEHQPLIDEMKRVYELIEAYLPTCEPHKLREYASSYAMLYPFAKQRQADPKIFDDLDFRILDAWMDGDKRINEIEIYSIVGRHFDEVQSDLKNWYQRKQAEFYLAIDEDGKFVDVSLLENYRILNGLWNDSIWKTYPYCSYGKADIAAMNYCGDLKTLDTETLCEYYRFQRRYACDMSDRVKSQRESAILEELSKREDLDEYDRKGYELDEFVAREVCV